MVKYSDKELDDIMCKYGPYFLNANDINEDELNLVKHFHRRFVDRTKTLNQKNDYEIISNVPTGTTNQSFEDLCNERAETLKDQNLILMWSGGLDSTTVLYALKNSGCRFTVLFNDNSVDECPVLGRELIKGDHGGISSMFRDSRKFNLLDFVIENPDAVFLTGEIGDQIFGSAIAYNLPYEVRQQHYTEVVPTIVTEIMNPIVETVLPKGLKNTTVAEYYWACNFLCKYQLVLIRMTFQYQVSPVAPFNNAIHFFDTEGFNLWSMQNYEENATYKSDNTYKPTMRKYLKYIGCNKDYINTKVKIGSLRVALYDAGRPKFNKQQIIG
jgi:hypothetical protein